MTSPGLNVGISDALSGGIASEKNAEKSIGVTSAEVNDHKTSAFSGGIGGGISGGFSADAGASSKNDVISLDKDISIGGDRKVDTSGGISLDSQSSVATGSALSVGANASVGGDFSASASATPSGSTGASVGGELGNINAEIGGKAFEVCFLIIQSGLIFQVVFYKCFLEKIPRKISENALRKLCLIHSSLVISYLSITKIELFGKKYW